MPYSRYETLLKTHGAGGVWVPLILLDIAGDPSTGLLLSQLVYWQQRAQVEREGHLWVAKGNAEWWEECRVPERTAKRCIEKLVEQGLVEKRLWKFAGVPRVHLRLVPESIEQAIIEWDNMAQPGGTIWPSGVGQSGLVDQDNLAQSYTETTTETTNRSSSPPSGDSASLSPSEPTTTFNTEGDSGLSTSPSATGMSSREESSAVAQGAAADNTPNERQDNLVEAGSGLTPEGDAIYAAMESAYGATNAKKAVLSTSKKGTKEATWLNRGRGELLTPSQALKVARLAVLFSDEVEAAGHRRPDPFAQRSLNAIKLLLVKDGATMREVEEVIEWTCSHHFWHTVVLSHDKFRAKWDTLTSQRGEDRKKVERQEARDAGATGEDWMARTAAPRVP